MSEFYRRALSKKDKLSAEQCRLLLVSAADELTRLETVLDSLPSGILVCDEKHVLVKANKAALRLLSLGQPELGLLWELMPDERIAGFFHNVLVNGENVLEHEIDVKVQGHNRLLSINVLPLVEKRSRSGWGRISGSLI